MEFPSSFRFPPPLNKDGDATDATAREARASRRTWLRDTERKPVSFRPPLESASIERGLRLKKPSPVRLLDLVTRLLENVSQGKQSGDMCPMFPPAVVQRYFDTEEDEERYPGVERPLNAIRVCSSLDHNSVPWYDCVNGCICSVAGNIWRANRAPRTPRQSSNAFATRDDEEEEERVRVLRGHFTPQFGTGRPITRHIFFPFLGPHPQPPKRYGIGEARGCSLGVVRSPRRGCECARYHSYMQRGYETAGAAAPIIADRRGHAEPKSSSFTLNRRASRVSIVVPLARLARPSAHGSSRP